MPLPPEIVALLAPDKVEAFEHAVEHFILNRVGGAIGRAVWRSTRRALGPYLHLPAQDMDMLRMRVEHIEDMISSLQQERESGAVDNLLENQNASTPAFDDFMDDALKISMRSATDGKCFLIGRLAAKRANVMTESTDDLLLRAALRATDETNIAQLYALVAVYFAAHTPLPAEGHAVAIWQQLDNDYGAVVNKICSVDWSADDLAYLASIGILEQNVERGLAGPNASRLERILSPGGRYWPVPMGSVPNTRFKELIDELDTWPTAGVPRSKPSIRGYHATPVGQYLARAMIDGLKEAL